MGQRFIQWRQGSTTLETGVCWLITSLTNTPQALTPGTRHGKGRAFATYQFVTRARMDSLKAASVDPDAEGRP